MNEPPAPKKKRVTKACDFCHTRSIRCRISDDDLSRRCKHCVEYNQACTFNRQSKKRGFPSGSRGNRTTSNAATAPPSDSHGGINDRDIAKAANGASDLSDQGGTSRGWKAQIITNQAVIVDLIEIYFEVVYPIFPLFHQPSLLRRVARGEYATDQPLYAAVMALCALSSARVRDGASFSDRWDMEAIKQVAPDQFFEAASAAIPKNHATSRDLRYLQSTALLALASLQVGNLHNMHFHFGIYQMLCKVQGLHKESNWPASAGPVEIEERRRLFWSMYTLDIYSAAVFGTIPNCREALVRVQYPRETDDEKIKDKRQSFGEHGAVQPLPILQDLPEEVHWLRGWNFTTDLYRILEHILDNSAPGSKLTAFCNSNPQEQVILDHILQGYAALPQRFKETHPITLDASIDRYSFQAANIAATIQLARMALLSASGTDSTTHEKCQVINELLQSFGAVPTGYLKAISTPLLYHLAGIGTVLWPLVERPLTGTTYDQVRAVLLSLADLLTTLETGMYSGGGASQRLRSHIQRMDEHVQIQRLQLIAQDSVVTTSDLTPISKSILEYSPTYGDRPNLSPEFIFPPAMLEDWSWVFDFTQDYGDHD